MRYDGGDQKIADPILAQWRAQDRLIVLCPEVAGGLSVPRKPCERDLKTGRIFSKDGEEFTAAFKRGAQEALKLVKKHHIGFALLKERSPSCGVNLIYDGHFTSTKIKGSGICASLLKENGVQVYSEEDIERLKEDLKALPE
ncbi:conserved hypothetical protein [Candidatus Terasakiella magnetica]|uniref:Uncharacterized protein n=1 Tax=Candidatus Terasakiella magnetica TaxID=1867952 RepID=A0A1C3RGH4_9PROT|nr:conserved hypothetical protein [Candidatus Terasakiella magnetica]